MFSHSLNSTQGVDLPSTLVYMPYPLFSDKMTCKALALWLNALGDSVKTEALTWVV
jgi:hypothetical protein